MGASGTGTSGGAGREGIDDRATTPREAGQGRLSPRIRPCIIFPAHKQKEEELDENQIKEKHKTK